MAFRDLTNKTPTRDPDSLLADVSRTPNSSAAGITQKTPNYNASISLNRSRKGLKKRELTPSRNPNFNGISCGDRFIPTRDSTQFEFANHCLVHHNSEGDSVLNLSRSMPNSPMQAEKMMKMKLMRGGVQSVSDLEEQDRILCFKRGKAPRPPVGCQSQPKVLYTSSAVNPSSSARRNLRHIPLTPERILDAPAFMDDYYLNLMDWGYNNVIAVALTYSLYLWNASTGEIITLFELPEDRGTHITSVRWAGEGPFLAIGFSDGQIKIFDPTRSNSMLRTMQNQIARVGSLSWREHVLSAGCRSGRIYHHDVRIAAHHIGTFDRHTQEVCGLLWSPDGRYLASGGGDNLVHIWEPSSLASAQEAAPLHTFTDHLASVKALAFNPHQSHSLATGGGSTDRCIKLWNLASGTLCHSNQTDSQVNAIAFCPHYSELVTGHGYPSHSLKIWKYPSMNCIQVLTGHTERILSLSMSPCGQYVMSASSDESLRLWWCFKMDKSLKNKLVSKGSQLLHSMR